MKIFVYKVVFIMISLFFLFNFTVGYQIRKIEDKIININSAEQINNIKAKLRKEMNSAINKDKIFNEDDKLLINRFIKKIILELELDK
ncbi:MAG: hypothetical protein CBC88_03535 [Candidatus Pelagibacter sp. TMED128]|nr:MAG: hypothetical protein CBC88_03535 [Candidatus Pelagibacter sp. TMED128]|tara:strand:- start:2331 stop:2594 length:264 start_codon:yes stop_codon:yes gene_type:complete